MMQDMRVTIFFIALAAAYLLKDDAPIFGSLILLVAIVDYVRPAFRRGEK